jgi:hypothetical protein
MSLFKEPVWINLRPSRRLMVWLSGLHGGAMLSLWVSTLPWTVKGIGSGIILIALGWQLYQQYTVTQHPLHRSVLNYDQLTLNTDDVAFIAQDTLSHRWFIVLSVITVTTRQRYRVLLLPDALDDVAQFRQLHIRLTHRFQSTIDKDF